MGLAKIMVFYYHRGKGEWALEDHTQSALLRLLSTPRGPGVSGRLYPQNVQKHGCNVFVTYGQRGKMVIVEELENS